MIPLKTDYAYAWLSDSAHISTKCDVASGFYYFDMRHLKNYAWRFMPEAKLLSQRYHANRVYQVWSLSSTDVIGEVACRRELVMHGAGFTDKLVFHNISNDHHDIRLALDADADFYDMFGLRSHWHSDISNEANFTYTDDTALWKYKAFDDVELSTRLHISPNMALNTEKVISLAPKESYHTEVQVNFTSSLAHKSAALPSESIWNRQFTKVPRNSIHAKAYKQAREDLYYLLLSTEQGLYAAAGVPWFVTTFGRDGLLTANMVLKNFPDLAKGTLRFLAAHQGKEDNAYYEEERGKILHEMRNCELARKKKIPFLTYYGTADATALWVKLLWDYYQQEQDLTLLKELLPTLEEALFWLDNKIKDTGFVQYLPEGQGLMNQSWKDATESNPHADGTLAEAPLAVVEVQGYTYAAFKAAAEIFALLDDNMQAQKYTQAAEDMYARIQEHYWLDELNNYAIALDKYGKPLKVNASNSGHLLWCNAVPKDKAAKLVQTLMSEDMYSGWGIRTLSQTEVAYNPLSYHTGCVWPHDTALAAHGMYQYGYKDAYARITNDLYDLAEAMGDFILPEVTSGFAREDHNLNIPYIQSCRPQAWAAAALLSLSEYGV